MKRVLHVLDMLSYGSGVAMVVMNYLRYIDKSRYVFDVVVHKPGEKALVDEVESLGGRVYLLTDITLSGFLKYYREFSDILINNKYDIVHGHISNAAFLYMTQAKKNGVSHRIIHAHNAVGAETIFKRLRNSLLEARIPVWCNHLFACSDLAAKYLFPTKNIGDVIIMPNAIDTDRFCFDASLRKEFRGKLKVLDNTFCVGHIGRFSLQKNHRFLLNAFRSIKKIHPNSMLCLVGDGPLSEEIQGLAAEYGLTSSVFFAGLVKDTTPFYAAFDIMLLPSLFEGWPVVGIEAQAEGLPCLFSSNITKTAKIIEEVVFLDLASPEEWAVKAVDLWKRTKRKEQSSFIKEKGMDIRTQAKALADIYDSYINN